MNWDEKAEWDELAFATLVRASFGLHKGELNRAAASSNHEMQPSVLDSKKKSIFMDFSTMTGGQCRTGLAAGRYLSNR